MINQLRKSSGYISIETVVVAGLIIGIGATTIAQFRQSANTVSSSAIEKVDNVLATVDSVPASTPSK